MTPPGDAVGDLGNGRLGLLPLEEPDQGLMHRAERVRRLVKSTRGQVLPVRADNNAADATEVDPLATFVRMQGRRVERADLFALSHVPLADRAQQVARQKKLTVRVELNAVDVQLMAGQFPRRAAVRRVSEADDAIVSRAGQELAVGLVEIERIHALWPSIVRRGLGSLAAASHQTSRPSQPPLMTCSPPDVNESE